MVETIWWKNEKSDVRKHEVVFLSRLKRIKVKIKASAVVAFSSGGRLYRREISVARVTCSCQILRQNIIFVEPIFHNLFVFLIQVGLIEIIMFEIRMVTKC